MLARLAVIRLGRGGSTILDFGYFAGDIFDHLPSPFLTCWDGSYFGNDFRSANSFSQGSGGARYRKGEEEGLPCSSSVDDS